MRTFAPTWIGLPSPASELIHATGRRSPVRALARFDRNLNRIPVHAAARPAIQTKLQVSTPGDAHEREADRVAEQVMRMPALHANGVTADHTGETASSGQRLDRSTREFMEQRFDHDFSRVRIHADATAAESAQSMNALAYTVGSDV